MRRPIDYVDEQIAKETPPIGILSVGREIRNGRWLPEIKRILRKRGVIPESDEELADMKDSVLKKSLERERRKFNQQMLRFRSKASTRGQQGSPSTQ